MTSNIVVILQTDITAGWNWVKSEAVAAYNFLQPKVAPILSTFEGAVEEGLWGAAAALLTKLGGWTGSLADLETALLNVLSDLGGSLLAAAQKLGSALVQTLLGAVNTQLAAAA
jgi:hypothetical protein